ncbi:PorH family porin [Corynebacterium mendelii]|uniref:PorH family porin n=1 Tax=Corynebacterium mendelii TaxID=2765362 RepID=A0A939E276_9CORY|nr:PorH family porin [Corynebacterium mendelii]MBN9645105.1 PorH family porin [Corynebacterium mendelii]
MDLDVIKEQLGNFKDFVESMSGLLKTLPASLQNLAGLFEGDIKPFGDTADYEASKKVFDENYAAAVAKKAK